MDKKLVRAMQLLKDERAQAQDKAQSAAEVGACSIVSYVGLIPLSGYFVQEEKKISQAKADAAQVVPGVRRLHCCSVVG